MLFVVRQTVDNISAFV